MRQVCEGWLAHELGESLALSFFGPGLSQSVRGVNVMRVRDGLIMEALGYVKSGDASVATAVRSATTASDA